MRCVIALMQHETNTYSPTATGIERFCYGSGLERPPSGQAAIDYYGSAGFAFSAMVDIAERYGAEISVPIAAYAEPSGKVTDEAFDFISDAICRDIAKGCDAVLLDLHGAMVTDSYFDGEGQLLERIRQIDADVPIAVALDFHTNLTEAMVRHGTILDGYRTYPHIDMYETGERATESLFKVMQQGSTVRKVWRTLPMMTHMIRQTPMKQPMKDIMDTAIEAVDSGQVMNASIFGGFPLADIPHVSLAILTIESSNQHQGENIVQNLCDMAWQRRYDFIYDPEPYAESIRVASSFQQGPVVIADHGDNCGAGGDADDLTVLNEMLSQDLEDIVAGPIYDPESVATMVNAGVGARVRVFAGGKRHAPSIGHHSLGIDLQGTVIAITDGVFTITGPMQSGLKVALGTTAVLRVGSLDLVLSEKAWEPYDLGCFTHAGIDPLKKRFILIKSRQHFRAAFEPIASKIVLAAGPGICSSDYSQFTFQNVRRPIFPLDQEMRLLESECQIIAG